MEAVERINVCMFKFNKYSSKIYVFLCCFSPSAFTRAVYEFLDNSYIPFLKFIIADAKQTIASSERRNQDALFIKDLCFHWD